MKNLIQDGSAPAPASDSASLSTTDSESPLTNDSEDPSTFDSEAPRLTLMVMRRNRERRNAIKVIHLVFMVQLIM